ncbi:MAG: hypothetical protein QM696_08040 [Steroidobacteraceae bacterium]
MRVHHVAWVAAALAGAGLQAHSGEAPANPMPSAQVLARASGYVPPKLGELAAKLAAQPDMTGIWAFIQAPGDCRGPLFDPAHSTCPIRSLDGEATFGPLPGTKVTSIPYNAEYQAIYDRHVAESLEGKARDTFATCIQYGVPRMVGESPTPFDIIQAPEVMIWYNDYARTERRIFLDGRAHPTGEDVRTAGPSYSGHSTGHWEGNTLVVDTVDMINAYFDETSSPHSDKLRMTERIRLIDKDLIENEMTLVDPEAFTRPWVVKRYYRRQGPSAAGQPARRYLDFNDRPCVPNVRLDEDGFQVLLLPQEIEEAEARAKGQPLR